MLYKIQKWLHDKLGWGFRVRKEGYTFSPQREGGYRAYYECKFCGSELEQDSQGNWFHLTNLIERE